MDDAQLNGWQTIGNIAMLLNLIGEALPQLIIRYVCTAVLFNLFAFTNRCDWSIQKMDESDWLRAVEGIQNSK